MACTDFGVYRLFDFTEKFQCSDMIVIEAVWYHHYNRNACCLFKGYSRTIFTPASIPSRNNSSYLCLKKVYRLHHIRDMDVIRKITKLFSLYDILANQDLVTALLLQTPMSEVGAISCTTMLISSTHLIYVSVHSKWT